MSCQILTPDSVQGHQGQSSVLKQCPRHKNKECIYLSTDPARTDDLVFKCEFCVVEQTLQSKYLLPISQLAASDLKTVFWHWPLPDNAELLEKKFRRVFDRIELGDAREESKRVVEFERLDEEEVAEVKAFAQRLIEAKKKRERGENGNTLKVEDLVGLLRNKANHTSEGMIEKSQALLDGMKRYVGTFEVEQIHKDGFAMEEFEGMSDSEINVAGKAIQEIKELFGEGEQQTEALEEVVHVGKKIASSIRQPRQLNSKTLGADKVIELVKNDTNFCSQEYVGSLQAALKGVKRYLESFELAERENEGLDKEQLCSLGKLGSKIKDLNARYGQSFKEREKPIEQEQPKSVAISGWISNNIGSDGIKELDKLLCKLPVFELTECQWIQYTSIQWKWMKTELWESSTLQLQNEKNGVRVIQKNKCQSQAVTDCTLDSNLVYSVKCTFNKPLNGVGYIMVGLIPEDKINTNYLGNDNYCSFYSYPGLGPSEIIKGQLLNSDALKSTLTTILFKFCIKTQTFLQSDPTLQNISKLDKNKINPNIKYRFGIQFQQNPSDYSCLFSDVMCCEYQAKAEMF